MAVGPESVHEALAELEWSRREAVHESPEAQGARSMPAIWNGVLGRAPLVLHSQFFCARAHVSMVLSVVYGSRALLFFCVAGSV
jgi:hypothetical protein